MTEEKLYQTLVRVVKEYFQPVVEERIKNAEDLALSVHIRLQALEQRLGEDPVKAIQKELDEIQFRAHRLSRTLEAVRKENTEREE